MIAYYFISWPTSDCDDGYTTLNNINDTFVSDLYAYTDSTLSGTFTTTTFYKNCAYAYFISTFKSYFDRNVDSYTLFIKSYVYFAH